MVIEDAIGSILRAPEWSTFNGTLDIKLERITISRINTFSLTLNVMHKDNESHSQVFNG